MQCQSRPLQCLLEVQPQQFSSGSCDRRCKWSSSWGPQDTFAIVTTTRFSGLFAADERGVAIRHPCCVNAGDCGSRLDALQKSQDPLRREAGKALEIQFLG